MRSLQMGFLGAAALTVLASVTPVSADEIYSTTQPGNQNYSDPLGMDFLVNSPVTVTALGAYTNGDANIPVTLYNVTTGLVVVGPTTISTTPGSPYGYVFNAITPVVLISGDTYQINAYGYNGSDEDYNPDANGTGPQVAFDTLGGELTAKGAYFGTSSGPGLASNSDNGTNTYGAGNLEAFVPLPAALPLFAGGLGVMSLIGRRRKQKALTAA